MSEVTWSITHKRVAGTHRAVCGAGYGWPSAISLTEDDDEVGCKSCRRLMKEREPWKLKLVRADEDDVIVLDYLGVKHSCVESAAHYKGKLVDLERVQLLDRNDNVIPRDEWPECPVDLSDPWMKERHGWTHR